MAVLIDTRRKRVAIQADVISRLKPGAETWDFYADADIENGWLVFVDVISISFEPAGPLPNYFINDVSVKATGSLGSGPYYMFELSIGSVDDSGNSTEVFVRIESRGLHLEDPAKPGGEIVAE